MKKMKLVALALSLISVLTAGNALAASATNVITINASVAGTCKFDAATSTLNLGALPFDLAGLSAGTSGNVDVTFWCTKGTTYTIDESSANSDTLKGLTTATETIAYTRNLTGDTVGTGAGATTTLTVNVEAVVAPLSYDSVSAQSYEDVVTLSFLP